MVHGQKTWEIWILSHHKLNPNDPIIRHRALSRLRGGLLGWSRSLNLEAASQFSLPLTPRPPHTTISRPLPNAQHRSPPQQGREDPPGCAVVGYYYCTWYYCCVFFTFVVTFPCTRPSLCVARPCFAHPSWVSRYPIASCSAASNVFRLGNSRALAADSKQCRAHKTNAVCPLF